MDSMTLWTEQEPNLAQRLGVTAITDWKSIVGQQILDNKARVDSPYQDEDRRVQARVRMEQSQFNLDNNINTVDLTAANFTTKIISQSMSLFFTTSHDPTGRRSCFR